MWKCHKCGKPVFFAERKQSLGYDWHPECLRCEECGKRLNPGQHAEHKGVPYCHVPCYGALFGPQLFGHGTRVESHKSFGQKGSPKLGNGAHGSQRVLLEAKLKEFNQYFEGKSGEVRSREVNGRLILEGSLRIFWGVHGVIHLKENDDQRTVVTVRKRNSCRVESDSDSDDEFGATDMSTSTVSDNISLSLEDESADRTDTGIESGGETTSECGGDLSSSTLSPINGGGMPKSQTLPSKLVDVKNMEWDELDDLLQVERKVDDSDKLYQTMPTPFPSQTSTESTSSESSSTDRNCINSTNTSYTNAESNISSDVTLKPFNHSDISEGSTVRNDDDTTRDSSATYRQYQQAVSGQSDDTWLTAQTSHHLNRSMSGPDCLDRSSDRRGLLSPPALQTNSNIMTDSATSCDISTSNELEEDVVVLRRKKAGSTAIKRRTGKRLSRSKVKRRCSINGHFYDRETSFFTPPHGSQMSVWVSSLVNTQEVINLMLEKYKVDSDARHFALFIVRDNGEQKRLKDDDYPLMVRVLLGPHEDVSRLFLMDSHNTPEVSNEVAQFLNLSVAECRAILNQYCTQEEREILRIQEKYREIRWRMKQKLEESK